MTAQSPALELRDVRKRYDTPGGTIDALAGMTLTAEQHKIHAFLGPNGAGKSTSLEMTVGSAAASPFSRRRPRSSNTCASASSWTCGPPSTTAPAPPAKSSTPSNSRSSSSAR